MAGIGRERKTQYERDRDFKAAFFFFLLWLWFVFSAWGYAFIADRPPVETWQFWVAFFLLWGPLSYITIEFVKEYKNGQAVP